MARVARKTGMELVLHIARLAWIHPATARLRGGVVAAFGVALAASLATYNIDDPSLNVASARPPSNALGGAGAVLADIGLQSLGMAAALAALLVLVSGLSRVADPEPDATRGRLRLRALFGTLGVLALAGALALAPTPAIWPLAKSLGGFWGDALLGGLAGLIGYARLPFGAPIAGAVLGVTGAIAYGYSLGLSRLDLRTAADALSHALTPKPRLTVALPEPSAAKVGRRKAQAPAMAEAALPDPAPEPVAIDGPTLKVKPPKTPPKESAREQKEAQSTFEFASEGGFNDRPRRSRA